MYTEEDINLMKVKGRMILPKAKIIKHYWISILLFLGVLVCVLAKITLVFILLLLISLLIAIIFNYRSLSFKKYPIKQSETDFQNAISASGESGDWTIKGVGKDYLHASTKKLSDILIMRDEDTIYFKALPYHSSISRSTNYNFVKNLVSIAKGEDLLKAGGKKIIEDLREYQNKSEWTLKNILKRTVGYLFAGFFLFIAYIGYSEEKYLLFIIPGLLAITYLILDAAVVIRKMKK